MHCLNCDDGFLGVCSVQIYLITHLKYVQFIVNQLYPNKSILMFFVGLFLKSVAKVVFPGFLSICLTISSMFPTLCPRK